MSIWIDILFLALGLALVVFGADFLVDGASAVARKFNVSEFVIGLTIVGFGTSCPELVVSLTGAVAGNADISLGNIVGSNIFNVLLILGLTAVISPIAITSENRRRDIPVCLLATVIFVAACIMGSSVIRIEGLFMLLAFALYLLGTFIWDKNSSSQEDEGARAMGLPKAILLVVAGLGFLIKGGDLFVDKAQVIARAAGVSDKFIAVTLLAGGTSLPELATCIVAAAKGRGQLALGNILGSNVFNMFLVGGASSLIAGMSTAGMDWFDWGAILVSILMLLVFSFVGARNRISRFEGLLLLLGGAVYFTHLFIIIS